MSQSAEPIVQEITSPADRPVAPHPPLRRYYDETEARQEFLNGLFNRTAYQYRNIEKATGFGSGLWYRRKALLDAGLMPGMTVLDVACGPGLVAQCALDLVGPSGSVIGLDPSIGMLREAQKGPCRNLVRGVGERLPFPDEHFDFVSMGYALRHVPDIRAVFAEYRRVLKPRGIVLLLEISRPRSALLFRLSRFYIKSVLGAVFAAGTGNQDVKKLMAYYWETIEQCVPLFVYHPEPWQDRDWARLSGLPLEDVWFQAADGARLFGWYVKTQADRPIILWCHGNAGNIVHRLDNLKFLYQRGLSVFLFDYRGYGRSQSLRPSEQGLYHDAVGAYDYLTRVRSIRAERLVLFGRSLGASVAGELAAQRPASALILESSFPSVEAVAKFHYGGLPVHWLIGAEFRLIDRLPRLTLPKLIIHGDRDDIVPLELGRQVFEAAGLNQKNGT